jgi:hypothetical protein
MFWHMKWTRSFLFLLLIPSFIHAAFYLKEYNKAIEKMADEWKRHTELVEQFDGFPLNEKQQRLDLIQESIACCQRAIHHCDHVLKKINAKSKEDRKEWKKKIEQCQQYKNSLNAEINHLQALTQSTLAFAKTTCLYQESDRKADLATFKLQNDFPYLSHLEEQASLLNDVAALY